LTLSSLYYIEKKYANFSDSNYQYGTNKSYIGSKIKAGDMPYQSDNKKELWKIFQQDYRRDKIEFGRLEYGSVDTYEEYSVLGPEFSEEVSEAECVQKMLMEQ